MSELQNKPPAEVLRTKRLEIVDDEGKVRAALGTNEEGVTSLTVFDQSGRLRASLDASEIPEQANGLALIDANGKLQVSVGASAMNVNEGGLKCYGPNGEDRVVLGMHKEGSNLYFNDTNDQPRADFGVYEDGQAGLSISAAEKDRHIKMAALKDGDLHIMLTESGAPRAALALAESENRELSPDLALIDKDGRAGVVVSGGSSSDPHLRLADRRYKVRGFFGLGVGGEPRLYVADEEGKPIGTQSALDRVVAERGLVYQALFLGALLFAGGFGGAWIAGTASTSSYSLLAAFITVVVLAALVGWLIMGRRR